MTEVYKCCKRIHGSGRIFRGVPCSKPAKVNREGQWYCSIHDPVRIEEKAVVKDAFWKKEWDRRALIDAQKKRNGKLLEALKTCAEHEMSDLIWEWRRESI